MAHNPRSPALTDAYRERLFSLRDVLEGSAERLWPRIEQLDGTEWPKRLAVQTEQAQATAVSLTAGYLGAFATSELGRPQRVQIDPAPYVGRSSDGQELAESFRSPLIGVLTALKKGTEPLGALEEGLVAARRLVGINFDAAHRRALVEAISADERFDGWSRALRGTCGACAGAAAGLSHALYFPVHPGCQCVSEPSVRGLTNRFPRPTGAEIFNQKSRPEQDEMLGPEAAEAVRSGAVALPDLVAHSETDSDQPNWITQRPISALTN